MYEGLDTENLADGGDHVVVDFPRSGDDATVGFETCSVREIERRTGHVSDPAAGLLNDKLAFPPSSLACLPGAMPL